MEDNKLLGNIGKLRPDLYGGDNGTREIINESDSSFSVGNSQVTGNL
jgi:hypothetical protein